MHNRLSTAGNITNTTRSKTAQSLSLARLLPHAAAAGAGPRAALRLPDVTSSSLRCSDGAIHFEAELTNGRWVHAKLFPEKPRFAGRGAKEVVFRVEPPEAAGEPVIRELIGAIAARALWADVLGQMPSEELIEGAFVERDGAIAHVDLRTVPSVRKAQSGGAASTMIDTLSIERIEVGDHGLQLVIALPSMG